MVRFCMPVGNGAGLVGGAVIDHDDLEIRVVDLGEGRQAAVHAEHCNIASGYSLLKIHNNLLVHDITFKKRY